MLTRKKIRNIICLTTQVLTVVDEILSIDIDYEQFLIYLKMFTEFLKSQKNASGKT